MQVASAEIDEVLKQHIVESGVAPGATSCVAFERDGRWVFSTGAAGRRSKARPEQIGPRSIFDLASVTKPIFAVLVARLAQRRTLSLDDRLGTLLPLCADKPAGRVSLQLLLAHRGGLEAHLELFAPLTEGRTFEPQRALEVAAAALRPECTGTVRADGFSPRYSDLGYLLLGAAIEQRMHAALDSLFEQELRSLGLAELGSARVLRTRIPDFEDLVVPTETVAYRGGEVVGAVHDDNAWAFAGHGAAGHAGLFGTATDVARFGCWMLDATSGRYGAADREALEPLIRRRPGGSQRAGFDGKSGANSAAGSRLGAETLGHLGFTGTSLWCDPEHRVAVVLLTNRVCPRRDNPRIRDARPRVHDALVDLVRHWKDTART